LAATGWDDYSLFLREDGLLVGCLVTEDFDAAKAAMEATDVNRRWQAEMAPYFVGLADGRPDAAAQPLREIFNLRDALASIPGHDVA
jgi:L-rhamnose mutarotase